MCAPNENRTRTRLLSEQDFLTTIAFATFSVCSLDYTFTLFLNLGVPCLVSTPSFSGLARYYHFKGFTEFTEFYSLDFSKGTQIIKSCVSTYSTTRAKSGSIPHSQKNLILTYAPVRYSSCSFTELVQRAPSQVVVRVNKFQESRRWVSGHLLLRLAFITDE